MTSALFLRRNARPKYDGTGSGRPHGSSNLNNSAWPDLQIWLGQPVNSGTDTDAAEQAASSWTAEVRWNSCYKQEKTCFAVTHVEGDSLRPSVLPLPATLLSRSALTSGLFLNKLVLDIHLRLVVDRTKATTSLPTATFSLAKGKAKLQWLTIGAKGTLVLADGTRTCQAKIVDFSVTPNINERSARNEKLCANNSITIHISCGAHTSLLHANDKSTSCAAARLAQAPNLVRPNMQVKWLFLPHDSSHTVVTDSTGCRLCGKEDWATYRGLKRHLRGVHTGGFLFNFKDVTDIETNETVELRIEVRHASKSAQPPTRKPATEEKSLVEFVDLTAPDNEDTPDLGDHVLDTIAFTTRLRTAKGTDQVIQHRSSGNRNHESTSKTFVTGSSQASNTPRKRRKLETVGAISIANDGSAHHVAQQGNVPLNVKSGISMSGDGSKRVDRAVDGHHLNASGPALISEPTELATKEPEATNPVEKLRLVHSTGSRRSSPEPVAIAGASEGLERAERSYHLVDAVHSSTMKTNVEAVAGSCNNGTKNGPQMSHTKESLLIPSSAELQYALLTRNATLAAGVAAVGQQARSLRHQSTQADVANNIISQKQTSLDPSSATPSVSGRFGRSPSEAASSASSIVGTPPDKIVAGASRGSWIDTIMGPRSGPSSTGRASIRTRNSPGPASKIIQTWHGPWAVETDTSGASIDSRQERPRSTRSPSSRSKSPPPVASKPRDVSSKVQPAPSASRAAPRVSPPACVALPFRQTLQRPEKKCHPVPKARPNVAFYASITKEELREGDLRGDSDDDSGNETLWQALKDDAEIELLDVTAEEKRFCKLWNHHVRHEDIKADRYFASSWRRFAETYADLLCQKEMRKLFILRALQEKMDGRLTNKDVSESWQLVSGSVPSLSAPVAPAIECQGWQTACLCGIVPTDISTTIVCTDEDCTNPEYHMGCVGLVGRLDGWLCHKCSPFSIEVDE